MTELSFLRLIIYFNLYLTWNIPEVFSYTYVDIILPAGSVLQLTDTV